MMNANEHLCKHLMVVLFSSAAAEQSEPNERANMFRVGFCKLFRMGTARRILPESEPQPWQKCDEGQVNGNSSKNAQ